MTCKKMQVLQKRGLGAIALPPKFCQEYKKITNESPVKPLFILGFSPPSFSPRHHFPQHSVMPWMDNMKERIEHHGNGDLIEKVQFSSVQFYLNSTGYIHLLQIRNNPSLKV